MRWLKRPKIKGFFFFLFLSMKLLFIFFGLFDVCVKQCCPTINRNFILLSCSNNAVSSLVFLFWGFSRLRGRGAGGGSLGSGVEVQSPWGLVWVFGAELQLLFF